MASKKHTKIGIIGAGAMGTAIANVIAAKGIHVDIWSYEQEVADDINKWHENKRYLEGIALSPNIKADTNIERVAANKNYLLLIVPSPFLIDITKKILHLENIREGNTLIGILTKGFVTSPRGTRLIVETLEDYLPGIYKGNLVYISGPSHAEEIARGKLTGLISASSNGKNTIQFRELLSGRNLIVFSSLDTIGVQVCAALKNVIAIAYGMLDALKETSAIFGDNTESLVMAAGLNEIQKLGLAMGSTHPETFTSIAGVGDLDVTCRSVYGRNRRLGREIILKQILRKFQNIDDLIENINTIGYFPEGIPASKRVFELAQEHNLKLPIATGVYRVLNKDLDPLKEIEALLKGFSRDSISSIPLKKQSKTKPPKIPKVTKVKIKAKAKATAKDKDKDKK
jgi:glycerol-3-phosphate dehydrogenase (NAD(P)+)